MESRPMSASPGSDEESLCVKTEVVQFNNVMDLKTDREVSRYFGKDAEKGRHQAAGGEEEEEDEENHQVDSRLSLLNSNNVFYRRESVELKKSDLDYKVDKICGMIKSERVDCDSSPPPQRERYASCDEPDAESRVAESEDEKVYRVNEKVNYDSDDNKMETVENMPLDLSVRSEIRDSYLMDRRTPPHSPGCRDSYTDSEDSDGPGGKNHGGKAYKKSLMKRYCKLLFVFGVAC